VILLKKPIDSPGKMLCAIYPDTGGNVHAEGCVSKTCGDTE